MKKSDYVNYLINHFLVHLKGNANLFKWRTLSFFFERYILIIFFHLLTYVLCSLDLVYYKKCFSGERYGHLPSCLFYFSCEIHVLRRLFLANWTFKHNYEFQRQTRCKYDSGSELKAIMMSSRYSRTVAFLINNYKRSGSLLSNLVWSYLILEQRVCPSYSLYT